MPDRIELQAGDGRLLISPHGARILACELPGVDGNLFYNNDANTGGDRLWIAPEVAYYWPSLDKAREDPVKHAITPPQVDPGNYQTEETWDDGIHLTNSFELTDCRDGKQIQLKVHRLISRSDPPVIELTGLKTASFSITNRVWLQGGDADAVAGAWDILQIPSTGTLICPTTHRVEPTRYYDPFGDKHVQADDTRVRFLIDGQRRIKMGIPAEATTGRMGYYRMVGDIATLIVRIFAPLPGETYVDVPRSADASVRLGGDCLQAYCDDGTYGDFGEMEYHDPAVIVGGPADRVGACVTHVFAGDDHAVRAAGQALLGVSVIPIE